MKKEQKCNKCENLISFPYGDDNSISPIECTFFAEIGEDTVTVTDGHTINDCSDLKNFRNIKITCKCGNVINFNENEEDNK